eukprot:SM000051S17581  [mRNA]  locus=s51:534066:536794:+ [translate_table: standard]
MPRTLTSVLSPVTSAEPIPAAGFCRSRRPVAYTSRDRTYCCLAERIQGQKFGGPLYKRYWDRHSGPRGLWESAAYDESYRPNLSEEAMAALEHTKLGFIGAGQMAEALAKGLMKANVMKGDQMAATDPSQARLDIFRECGALALEKSEELDRHDHKSAGWLGESAVQGLLVLCLLITTNAHFCLCFVGDLLHIAAKLCAYKASSNSVQVCYAAVQSVLQQLRDTHVLTNRQLVVSIAAGVTLAHLQEWAGAHARVVRVMPNTPCFVGETAAAMSPGKNATEEDAALVQAIFEAVGKIHLIDEKLLDAVTGLSGSGPAYVFIAIEALADGGVAAGLPREVALSLAAQTVLGSAKMVLDSGKHPGQLKDSVASPGGTTIAGIHELEKGGFRASIINAVLAATARSKDMGK